MSKGTYGIVFFLNVCFCRALCLSPSISLCYPLSIVSVSSCLSAPPVCRFKKKRLRTCHQHAHVLTTHTWRRFGMYQQMTMSPGPVVHIGRTRQSGSMVFSASHGSAQNQGRQGQQTLPRGVVSERHNGGQRLHQNVAKPHALPWSSEGRTQRNFSHELTQEMQDDDHRLDDSDT